MSGEDEQVADTTNDTVPDAGCDDPATTHPNCLAEGLRGADDCPGPSFDPAGNGSHFCLPVPPAPPRPPAPVHPAFQPGPYPDEPCPDVASGRCNREVPCAAAGQVFPEEQALRALFDAPEIVAVHYVDPQAATEGDGSRERPWRDLQEHMHELPHHAIVAVAPGTLEGALLLDRTVRILGACDGATTLRALEGDEILVTVRANDVELVSLAFEPELHGILASRAAGVVLQQVDLRGVTGRGVNVENGASVWLEDVRVTARPGGRRALALFAHSASIDGQRVHLEGWWAVAVNAQVTATYRLRDLTINGTAEAASDMFGLWTSAQGRIEVTRMHATHAGSSLGVVDGRAEGASPVLEVRDLTLVSLAPTGETAGWRRHGFLVAGRGTVHVERVRAEPLEALFLSLEEDARAVLRDIDLEGIRNFVADRSFNVPFQLLDRSHLDAGRVRVASAETYAIGLLHEASAEVEDLIVGNVVPDAGGIGPGRAITLSGTGAFSLRRADLRFGGDHGLVLTGPDIELEDVSVAPAEDAAPGIARRGMIAQNATDVVLRRVHTHASSAGVGLLNVAGTVTGEDIVVEQHHPVPGAPAGINVGGLRLESVHAFDLSRVALVNNAWPAAQAGLSGGVFRDMWIGSSVPGEPSLARGLIVHEGEVAVERVLARDVRGYALLAYGSEGHLAARDVVVVGSRVGLCGDASCNVDGCAVSVEGGVLDIAQFWLEDADLGAICMRGGASVQAHTGMLVRNRNGVVLDGAHVDLDQDFEDVVLVDNERGVVSDQVVRSGTPDTSTLVP